MLHHSDPLRPRRSMRPAVVATAVALLAVTGLAAGGSFTLQAARHAPVKNKAGVTKHESIAVDSRGFAVYTLTGDSRSHPECTKANTCLRFWPPVTVGSATTLTKASGIKGQLGRWHRNGFTQLTLAGHPLYNFFMDTHKRAANGEGIVGFGGTWHVVTASG